MLGDILRELAAVEIWLTDLSVGHEDHDPNTCAGAAIYAEMSILTEDTVDECVSVVVYGLIALLKKTNDPSKAGALIVDKVRALCATMARDRIRRYREASRRGAPDWPTRIDRIFNTPN